VKQLFTLLFGFGALVRVAGLRHGETKEEDDFFDNLRLVEDVTDLFESTSDEFSLYFGLGIYRWNASSAAARNVVAIGALCFDIDYGKRGHKKESHFDDESEALAHLQALPERLQPQVIWNTGNGFQVLYLLPEHLDLTNDANRRAFKSLVAALALILKADAAPSEASLFRVPGSFNHKRDTMRFGRIFRMDLKASVRLETLQEQVATEGYATWGDNGRNSGPEKATAEIAFSHDTELNELPKAIRERLTAHHKAGTRSEACFGVIRDLAQAGYTDEQIEGLMHHAPSFVNKYGDRLDMETRRCLGKIHQSRPAPAEPTSSTRQPQILDPAELPSLSPDMESMLSKLWTLRGDCRENHELERRTACGLEHLVANHLGSAASIGCGEGKSTWAMCHLATRPPGGRRYAYVAETTDVLYETRDLLVKLNPDIKVGTYHGFQRQRCHALCGEWRKLHQVAPLGEGSSSGVSACTVCTANAACVFYNRQKALDQDILLLTHEGLIGLLARGTLRDLILLIDEDLGRFSAEKFSKDEIAQLNRCLGTVGRDRIDWTCLFPGMSRWGLGRHTSNTSRASEQWSYLILGALQSSPNFSSTRQGMGRGIVALRKRLHNSAFFPGRSASDLESALGTLFSLNRLFQGNSDECAIAYREVIDPSGERRLTVKRDRAFIVPSLADNALILSADASASTNLPAKFPVFGIRPHAGTTSQVALTVIRGNPFGSKLEAHLEATLKVLKTTTLGAEHNCTLVCSPKPDDGWPEGFLKRLQAALGLQTEIIRLRRGRFRGTNEARECTLAILSTVPFFTNIDDIATSAVLRKGAHLPLAEVFAESKDGVRFPKISQGRFVLPELQELFMLRCLAEIHQALFRSAVRDGKPVDVILVLPDEVWLASLWNLFLPGFTVLHAFKIKDDGDLEADEGMMGMATLLRMEAGEKVGKSEAARLLGYEGRAPWKDNKRALRALLRLFFDGADTRAKNLIRTSPVEVPSPIH